MEITDQLYVTNRDDWRKWLKNNYDKSSEIWLVYYKKHTGKLRIPYDDAVEEALCFGWIDSTVKRVDDEVFVQRFTPRIKKGSKWSELNKKRARNLINEGRMTPAGMAHINPDEWEKENDTQNKEPEINQVPAFIEEALVGSPVAAEHFYGLPPYHRKRYLLWIMSAKKEETRLRRLKEALALLNEGQPLPMK